MSRCAPTNAPSAAIERHPWAASCSSPGLKWILTSMLPLPDTTWTLVFRPPRETPTDREPPFFGAPAACWWTFTLVEFMASTRISTPMIRSSCSAVNRCSIAPFPDQRLNRRQTVIHLP